MPDIVDPRIDPEFTIIEGYAYSVLDQTLRDFSWEIRLAMRTLHKLKH